MKLKTFFIILVFAVMALSACGQASETALVDIEGKCIRTSDDARLLIDFVHGYCLQYPAEYDIARPNENEIMLIKGSMLNVSEPGVHIEVKPAQWETVEEAAQQLVMDVAVPGFDVTRTPLTIDGEEAMVLDGLSGQEINRQVVVLHNDYLYHLYFMPMDESQPEAYARSEALYNSVIQSFNFHPETSSCPDCPPSEAEAGGTQGDPQSASISGWVWHDLCDTGMDGEPAVTTTPAGCVEDVSALGKTHADGLMSIDEPLIDGVVVMLGEGVCPSTGLAEMPTITTDLSFYFTGLKAGTYCVSIDPQREPNFSILRPGEWTFPTIEQGVINTTVTLAPGEYKGMVNFGWDFQFEP